MKIRSQKMFLVQNKVVAQQFRVAAKELPQGQEQLMTIAKGFFGDSSDGTLDKVLTFQLEKHVRKCANIFKNVLS